MNSMEAQTADQYEKSLPPALSNIEVEQLVRESGNSNSDITTALQIKTDEINSKWTTGITHPSVPQDTGSTEIREIPTITTSQQKIAGAGIWNTSVLQIVNAVGAIVMNIVCCITTAYIPSVTSIAVPGIWAGFMFFAAGCVGISAYKSQSRNKLTAYMVLSILSAIMVAAIMFTTILDLVDLSYIRSDDPSCWWTCDSAFCGENNCCYPDLPGCGHIEYSVIYTCSILLFISVVELVTAITGASYCCGAVCCKTKGNGSAEIGEIPTTITSQSKLAGNGIWTTSILQSVIAVAAVVENVVCCIATAYIPSVTSLVVPGIWAGCMFLAAGCVGLSAYKSQSRNKITAYMVLSILSAIMVAPIMFTTILDLVNLSYIRSDDPSCYWTCNSSICGENNCCYPDLPGCGHYEYNVIYTCSILLIISVAELATAITGASYCCGTVCCKTRSGPGQPYQIMPNTSYPTAPVSHQQQSFYAPGKGGNMATPTHFPSGQPGAYPAGPMGQFTNPQLAQDIQNGTVGPYSIDSQLQVFGAESKAALTSPSINSPNVTDAPPQYSEY